MRGSAKAAPECLRRGDGDRRRELRRLADRAPGPLGSWGIGRAIARRDSQHHSDRNQRPGAEGCRRNRSADGGSLLHERHQPGPHGGSTVDIPGHQCGHGCARRPCHGRRNRRHPHRRRLRWQAQHGGRAGHTSGHVRVHRTGARAGQRSDRRCPCAGDGIEPLNDDRSERRVRFAGLQRARFRVAREGFEVVEVEAVPRPADANLSRVSSISRSSGLFVSMPARHGAS